MARTISGVLGLNEELAEAIALAHDLGHTPFGHTGEDALSEAMAPYGGFDHNAQAVKIVTELEAKYAEFDGLNLTWECLEGIAKHNGPVTGELPEALRRYNEVHDLELHSFAGAEAQVAAVSDDIAYNNHDLDDGLRAGLFSDDQICDLPLIGACYREVDQAYGGLDISRRRHEALRRVFGRMVEDVIDYARAAIAAANPQSVADIRNLGRPVAQFSDEMTAAIGEIRQFLFEHMYRAPTVMEMRAKTAAAVSDLFAAYMGNPALMPEDWGAEAFGPDTNRARVVADYIAGMTDRYALDAHARLPSRACA